MRKPGHSPAFQTNFIEINSGGEASSVSRVTAADGGQLIWKKGKMLWTIQVQLIWTLSENEDRGEQWPQMLKPAWVNLFLYIIFGSMSMIDLTVDCR